MKPSVNPINKKIRIRKYTTLYIFTDVESVRMVKCVHPGTYMMNEELVYNGADGTSRYYARKFNITRTHMADGNPVQYTHWAISAHHAIEVT